MFDYQPKGLRSLLGHLRNGAYAAKGKWLASPEPTVWTHDSNTFRIYTEIANLLEPLVNRDDDRKKLEALLERLALAIGTTQNRIVGSQNDENYFRECAAELDEMEYKPGADEYRQWAHDAKIRAEAFGIVLNDLRKVVQGEGKESE